MRHTDDTQSMLREGRHVQIAVVNWSDASSTSELLTLKLVVEAEEAREARRRMPMTLLPKIQKKQQIVYTQKAFLFPYRGP